MPPAALLSRAVYSRGLMPILSMLDTNGDGLLSADELAAAVAASCAWITQQVGTCVAWCRGAVRTVRRAKPIRAVLDLTDADEWVVQQAHLATKAARRELKRRGFF
jgi:hypothetical protein